MVDVFADPSRWSNVQNGAFHLSDFACIPRVCVFHRAQGYHESILIL